MRAIVLLLLLPLLGPRQGEFDDAKALYEQKKFAEAAAALEKVVEKDPEHVEAYHLLLKSYRELTKLREAVGTLKKAEKAGHNVFQEATLFQDTRDLLNWAIEKGKPEEKRDVFEEFRRQFPDMPKAWIPIISGQLLTAYAKLKDEKNAADLEKELLSEKAGFAEYWAVGYGYLEADFRPKTALECMKKAIRLHLKKPPGSTAIEKDRHATELSVYRSFLAYAYHLNGILDPGENTVAAGDAEPGTTFVDATEKAGLKEARGSRFAVGDYDGDGWDDLLCGDTLWRNNKGRFEKSDALEKVPGNGRLWGDLDNDGKLDLVAIGKSGVRVFRNTGKPGFEEVTSKSAFEKLPAGAEGNALVDVDSDGLLDLYVAVYETPSKLGEGNHDRFYRNKGGFVFEDETEARGLRAGKWCGRGVNAADFDNDGDQDIYVSNYRLNPNFLYRNDGSGNFENAARALGVEGVPKRGAYGHTIGSCWGDLDNDGDLDLIAANLAHPRFIEFSNKTMVYRNLGEENGWTFENVFPDSGIEYEETHSDVSMADVDNDGDLDVFFTSVYKQRPSFLYQNEGDFKFRRITWKAGVISFNGWGHVWLDHDNDGDMDLVTRRAGGIHLFENRLKGANSWIEVRLCGKTCNRSAIGARITVIAGERRFLREVSGGRGTTSQDSLVQHVGLGLHEGTVDLEIRWGKGPAQTVRGLKANRRYKIEQE